MDESTAGKLRRLDEAILGGRGFRVTAADLQLEYGVVVARARDLMRREVQLTLEEVLAWGICEQALIREARRRHVLPEVESALRKIRRAVIDEEAGGGA